jgi:glycosyltransferase involved in cell wall biosynthesis
LLKTSIENPAGNAPLVTALVSAYKSERFVRGCLEDLVAQTIFDRTEVIVIDSASPENERVVVEEFQKVHPNIRYFRTPERETLYAAWNRGIRMATGKYLTNANTDDRHAPIAFEKLTRYLEQHPAVGVVYATTAITTAENQRFDTAPRTGRFKARQFDRRRLFWDCLPGPQPVWRKELHDRFGFFDETFSVAGDYEFWLRVSGAVSFGHLPECLGLFLASAGSLAHSSNSRTEQEAEAARDRHWPKEWGPRSKRQLSFIDKWTRRSTYRALAARLGIG